MYPRALQPELQQAALHYPVVTVLGPRQSGKTTLVQETFPEKPYINLEAPDIRELAIGDPRGFLEQYPEGAILDEIQRVPTLLSYLQVIVDQKQKNGIFILTGSHQLDLHEAITQSLAGRTALLSLLPMSLQELKAAGIELTLEEALLKGGFPRIFKEHQDPTKAYRNYLHTYVERDLRQLINVKDLIQFQRFVRLLASRVGQLASMEGLGNEVGVSSHTIKHWISILEASYIVIRLQPYYENFGKRIIKSPKIFFSDVGFATYLLGIENVEQLDRDPLRGHLLENLAFLELLKARTNKGLDPQLYFFRDVQGHEVDFIFQKGRQLVPIEVKAAKTFNSDFLKNLRYFKNLVPDRVEQGYLIYSGPPQKRFETFELLNFHQAVIITG